MVYLYCIVLIFQSHSNTPWQLFAANIPLTNATIFPDIVSKQVFLVSDGDGNERNFDFRTARFSQAVP